MSIADDPRAQRLSEWLCQQTGAADIQLEVVSGDASFRRYFRFFQGGKSLIAVDAPPAQEDSQPFIHIAGAYAEAGIRVPKVHHRDLTLGFMCLEDFGDDLLLPNLTPENAAGYYAQALNGLPQLMQVQHAGQHALPTFDRALLAREISLFTDWLLDRHLGLTLSDSEQQILDNLFAQLIHNALSQPQVGVHRDYHSRNLMLLADGGLGVIDFQDAVVGPITYDAVSLLRDCYIHWPDDFVYRQLEAFRQLLLSQGLLEADEPAQFKRWFDLMGMQRHLKASGIFCRLNYRDSKPGYLADVPRTVGYIVDVGRQYENFLPAVEFLEQRVLPALDNRNL